MPINKLRRCAIYTRKSSEEGLEQEFNSLQAQREACEAFIQSQAGEGWRLIKTHYDDGGLSGATLERPSLQQLLADIGRGLVDIVVVYKVDRLTRSLADFAKIVEIFDAHQVSFVAVTQQFNTTTSMGRLTLNMLLAFAQFEREVTGERIRDKIAASKRKGMWMGGYPPLGYDVSDHQLRVNVAEAATVRHIFQRYLALGRVRRLKAELDQEGIRSKQRVSASGRASGGQSLSRGALYSLLRNPIYVGAIRHKGTSYPGQHEAIIGQETWEQTADQLGQHNARARVRATGSVASPLIGKVFDEQGEGLTPTHAKKGQRRYRYYVSRNLLKGGREGWRVPSSELEQSVTLAVRQMLDDQRWLVSAVEARDGEVAQITALLQVAAERSRQLRSAADNNEQLAALVERIDLKPGGLRVTIKLPVATTTNPNGTVTVARELPLQIRRRGVEKRLLISSGVMPMPRVDHALLKAVARGHSWLEELVAGRVPSMQKIAMRERVSKRYVSRLIRLGLLGPEVVELIAAGQQAPELTTQSLVTGEHEISLNWQLQRQTFAISPQP